MKRKTVQCISATRLVIAILFLTVVAELVILARFSLFKKTISTQAFHSASEIRADEMRFAGTQAGFEELSAFYRDLALKKGAVYAFSVLRDAPLPPRTDTHLLGHVVGDILFSQQGISGMRFCTDDFRNACSHSIVIGAFLKYGQRIIPQLGAICRQAPGGGGAYTMCFHGLGHGVLAYTNYNLPKAIQLCGKLGENGSKQEEKECVGGETMEIIKSLHDTALWRRESKKYLSAADPLKPCDQVYVPDIDKSLCYVYLTPHLFDVAGMQDLFNPTPEQVYTAMHYCDAVDDSVNRTICYGGFGKEFLAFLRSHDIRNLGTLTKDEVTTVYHWCAVAKDHEAVAGCLATAETSMYWGGEVAAAPSITFCAVVSLEYKEECYHVLIDQIHQFKGNTLAARQQCDRLPDPYNKACAGV